MIKLKHCKTLLASVCLTLLTAGASAQNKTIAIGYQLPLSGENAQYGMLFRNSATLALDDFNKSGKLPGVTVQIKFEDSKSDAKEGVNIARKFSDDSSILAVIGDFNSTVSMAAGQVYAQTKVAQLSQTASHPDFVKISEYQFRNINTQAYEGPLIANWAHGNGVKKVAVVAIQNDWGQSAANNFINGFKAAGGTVTDVEYFNPGTRDFRSILTKIGRSQPEAIFLGAFYEDGSAFLQQKLQMGLKQNVYATSSLYEKKMIELAGPAANGLYLTSTFLVESTEPHIASYVKAYEARYGAKPQQFAAQAFDATNIMLNAIVAAGGANATRAKVRDALAATKNFPGVTGTTSFDQATREPIKLLTKLQVTDGKFVSVK
ncbi:ABC transporter substrate-binding protein [Propionivibrio dicarboxylicus]|uniref:Branched-chain amino acid transport system substrate-binding protein n=1 Tax=Propionivibrio dicarboxylicus TaxID=83767 RepID=A0A1G8LI13_9RHOO|nr:ABC transporter substrate-binding protein [Propionivibrio dicarboxylicus]SDI55265.1 branched-chain amino acid transport system substrate-binding protein [Propionivibrio dicarboxylicus]